MKKGRRKNWYSKVADAYEDWHWNILGEFSYTKADLIF